MSGPENPRVEVVQERLERALPLLSGVDCPSISDPDLCAHYDGDCRRCWLDYLKGVD